MSRKIENVVYMASWRNFILANFAGRSFSTATGDSAQNPVMPRGSWPGTWRKNGSPSACPPVSRAALPH
jgi:hypothetical protein